MLVLDTDLTVTWAEGERACFMVIPVITVPGGQMSDADDGKQCATTICIVLDPFFCLSEVQRWIGSGSRSLALLQLACGFICCV